ncbi:hypothetical protein M409DRAFT_36338 [Zasmidium cellare ATCC 36951]|uniref:AB hydrolase-1 domain-containing protein n=1 Tax=Zasmidium cellare ATCC 36951 TaxID=1080233 RepID=A0A6A6CSU8_ZASCE|nr:uncharacterized protein M409DRAFT_36338 [Zasmidium cellare ATCC 36951]KAF2168546.1 hypothetical protein M409DRAFT_36338 [Zasmidium cellare ATCC 36951]
MQNADLPLDSPSAEPGIIIDYIYCPTPKDIQAKGTILLIHGFPQTNYQFRRVITPLAKRGYNVIVPNYRGAGASSKPWNGYTKKEMAADLHTLVERLGVKGKVHVVGHDIGGMIAHAYAMQYPNDTASIIWGECPIPGSPSYDKMKNDLVVWHFTFQNIPDLPEALVQGRERIYIKHFFDRLAQNPNAISTYDLDVYTDAYAAAGAMRAGFNVYRTFEQDVVDNRKLLQENGKSSVPCLTLWGGKSFADEATALEMSNYFFEQSRFASIPGAGHYIAKEAWRFRRSCGGMVR